MNSSKVITETSSHNTLIGIKLEPADSIENVSEQTEAISDISELLQNFDKSFKNKNGTFLLY